MSRKTGLVIQLLFRECAPERGSPVFTKSKYKHLAYTLHEKGFGYLDPRIMNLSKFKLGIPSDVFAIDAGRRTWILAFIASGSWGYTVVEITDASEILNVIDPVWNLIPSSDDMSCHIIDLLDEHKD
jgi:hypothetical protein